MESTDFSNTMSDDRPVLSVDTSSTSPDLRPSSRASSHDTTPSSRPTSHVSSQSSIPAYKPPLQSPATTLSAESMGTPMAAVFPQSSTSAFFSPIELTSHDGPARRPVTKLVAMEALSGQMELVAMRPREDAILQHWRDVMASSLPENQKRLLLEQLLPAMEEATEARRDPLVQRRLDEYWKGIDFEARRQFLLELREGRSAAFRPGVRFGKINPKSRGYQPPQEETQDDSSNQKSKWDYFARNDEATIVHIERARDQNLKPLMLPHFVSRERRQDTEVIGESRPEEVPLPSIPEDDAASLSSVRTGYSSIVSKAASSTKRLKATQEGLAALIAKSTMARDANKTAR